MENKKELTAVEQFRRHVDGLFNKCYQKGVAYGVKKAWKLRKEREKRLSTKEIDM